MKKNSNLLAKTSRLRCKSKLLIRKRRREKVIKNSNSTKNLKLSKSHMFNYLMLLSHSKSWHNN